MAINLKDHVENSIKNILCFDVKVDANENSSEIYIYNEDETILRITRNENELISKEQIKNTVFNLIIFLSVHS
jgi:hypothetical protein